MLPGLQVISALFRLGGLESRSVELAYPQQQDSEGVDTRNG